MAAKEKLGASLFGHIKRYIDLKVEDLKLSATENVGLLVGRIVFLLIASLFLTLIFALFLVFMYDILLQWVGMPWIASLIEFGFVLLLFIVLICFKKNLIIYPIANSIIRVFYEKSEEEEV